jgi:hypothetical protein
MTASATEDVVWRSDIQPRVSVNCRIFRKDAGRCPSFLFVPLGADFTPSTCLIFINNTPEKVGEK